MLLNKSIWSTCLFPPLWRNLARKCIWERGVSLINNRASVEDVQKVNIFSVLNEICLTVTNRLLFHQKTSGCDLKQLP